MLRFRYWDIIALNSMCIKENRAIERYSLRVPVVISTLGSDRQKMDDIITKDISSCGVFIESNSMDLDPGSEVHVEIVLTVEKLKELFKVSDKVVLEVDGRITRVTRKGIAVKFTDQYSIKPLYSGAQLK